MKIGDMVAVRRKSMMGQVGEIKNFYRGVIEDEDDEYLVTINGVTPRDVVLKTYEVELLSEARKRKIDELINE